MYPVPLGILSRDDEYQAAHAEISRIEQQHLSDSGFSRNPVTQAKLTQLDDEIKQLSRAYDRVKESHTGPADDPLVLIKPEDIESVAIARGGWKSIGDIEVKGSGWGLAKFIWRHGESSQKPKKDQITKNDILEFPNIIRNFEPSRKASEDGSRGREWRVNLKGRTVVFAENSIEKMKDRHMVSVYIQDKNHVDASLPLSTEKTKTAAQGSIAEVWSPTNDTARDISILQRGLEQPFKSVDQTKSNVNNNDTPEITAAREALPSIPEDKLFEIERDDGTTDTGTAAELMARADEEAAFAEQSDTATQAAINCFLKWGDV